MFGYSLAQYQLQLCSLGCHAEVLCHPLHDTSTQLCLTQRSLVPLDPAYKVTSSMFYLS